MAKISSSMNKNFHVPGPPKKTRQGQSKMTLTSATSRNGKQKKYRGQGKGWFNWIPQSQSLPPKVMVGHFF